MLTKEQLIKLFAYDKETGILRRISGQHIGNIAGTKDSGGYVQVKVNGRKYMAHQIIWCMMTGIWPEIEVDHINRVRYDNNWSNLRLSVSVENSQNKGLYKNNKSGVKGITWNNERRKWRARIRIDGRLTHLGYFEKQEDASEAYLAAKSKFHPFYSV